MAISGAEIVGPNVALDTLNMAISGFCNRNPLTTVHESIKAGQWFGLLDNPTTASFKIGGGVNLPPYQYLSLNTHPGNGISNWGVQVLLSGNEIKEDMLSYDASGIRLNWLGSRLSYLINVNDEYRTNKLTIGFPGGNFDIELTLPRARGDAYATWKLVSQRKGGIEECIKSVGSGVSVVDFPRFNRVVMANEQFDKKAGKEVNVDRPQLTRDEKGEWLFSIVVDSVPFILPASIGVKKLPVYNTERSEFVDF